MIDRIDQGVRRMAASLLLVFGVEVCIRSGLQADLPGLAVSLICATLAVLLWSGEASR